MKKDIILQNQHFLKKNYTYNFFRSFLKFNIFFLKNNFFFLKYFKLLNFFFFTNFFLKKKIIFNKFNIFYSKKKNSIFFTSNNYNKFYLDLFGKNYLSLNSNLSDTELTYSKKLVIDIYKKQIKLKPIKYNYNINYSFHFFMNLYILLYVIKN